MKMELAIREGVKAANGYVYPVGIFAKLLEEFGNRRVRVCMGAARNFGGLPEMPLTGIIGSVIGEEVVGDHIVADVAVANDCLLVELERAGVSLSLSTCMEAEISSNGEVIITGPVHLDYLYAEGAVEGKESWRI